MSDEQLTEWERLAEAATEAPWSAADEHGLLGEDAEPAWCVSRMRSGYDTMSETEGYLYDIAYTTGTNEQPDAEFIAAAREALPALIADLRASRAREAELTTHVVTTGSKVLDLDGALRKMAEAFDRAITERDGLQQRIDKARQLAEAARSLVPHAPYTGVGWQALLDVLDGPAALTGMEPTNG